MPPLSGATSPVNWPIRVDLPAPFGPMIACSSPAGSISEISSAATTPPKRLVKASISSRASATTRPRNQAIDAALPRDRHQKEERPEDQIGIIGHTRKPFL